MVAHGQVGEVLPAPQGAVTVVKPERGFVDDAFALSEDGSVFFYVNTDGASWASLRAVGLPPRPRVDAGSSAPASSSGAPDAAGTPPLRTAGGQAASKPLLAAAKTPPPKKTPPAPAFTVAAGQSLELLTGLQLSVAKMALLPDDRVLLVMRDLDAGGMVNGSVYSLRSRAAVPVPGGTAGSIGPATDIMLAESPSGPVIVAATRPIEARAEYQIQVWNAATLKLIGQRSYRLREGDGRVMTAQGSALPLYFIDDYQTLVAKHDGYFDKKKDIRQPDFLAFVDSLTAKVRRSQPISDPTALLELARVHKEHGESVFPFADPETQKIFLYVFSDRAAADTAAESRSELRLPRPSSTYDGTTLRYQRLRPDRLLLSLAVDPVNEQAVAQRRTDLDDIDFCLVDPYAPAAVQKLRTLPGHKRPSAWTASVNGRVALLRKHKNFPRGGPQVEVYDLSLDGSASADH